VGVETDSKGNIYYFLNGGGSGRLNPDGSLSQVFTTRGFNYGIDADANGNVYVKRLDAIYKYNAVGAEIGFTADPHGGDIAIDEIGQVLYVARGGIRAYDISGELPVFVKSIPTPAEFAGLAFDPRFGHLFGTGLFEGKGWELTTSGQVIRDFKPDDSILAFDIVPVHVPEPSALALAACSLFAISLIRRRSN
jgi:hypothetical protein